MKLITKLLPATHGEMGQLVKKPVEKLKLRQEGNKLAVVDVVMLITDMNNDKSGQYLRRLKQDNPDFISTRSELS